MQIITESTLDQFINDLNLVEKGVNYLRVRKTSWGGLIYETTEKKHGFAGLIQYIMRLFDSSYNVNNSFTLLAAAFQQFKATPVLEKATQSLIHIGEHVNTKRILRKIDLSYLKSQKAHITTQIARDRLPKASSGFPPPPPRSPAPVVSHPPFPPPPPLSPDPPVKEIRSPAIDLLSSVPHSAVLRDAYIKEAAKIHLPEKVPAAPQLPPATPPPPPVRPSSVPAALPPAKAPSKTPSPPDSSSLLAPLLLSKIPASPEILRKAEEKTASIFSDIERGLMKWPREKVGRLVSHSIIETYTPLQEVVRTSLFKLSYFITSAFKKDEAKPLEILVEELYDDIKKRGGKWEQIKGQVLKAQAEVFSSAPNLVNHAPTWLHGSSLSMLPGAVRMVLPEGVPSLIPSGMLLRHGYAPLTGEVCVGVSKRGINQYALSGVGPSYFHNALRYAYIPSFAFAERRALEDVLNTKSDGFIFERLKIMVLRLFLTKSINTHREVIISHLRSLAAAFPKIPKSDDWIKALGFLEMTERELGPCTTTAAHDSIECGSVVLVPRSSGETTLGIVESVNTSGGKLDCFILVNERLEEKVCNKSVLRKVDVTKLPAMKAKSITKETAEAIEEELLSTRENLENLIKVIEAHASPPPSLIMSHASTSMLNEHIPIVFASYTAKDFERVRSDIKGEIGLRGAQEFGKDIQTLFCPEKDVERLRTWLGAKLAEHGTSMNVLSFEASYYLYAQTMKAVAANGTACF